MAVTQQIDAIRALGTDPIQKIVAPKILAVMIAAPLLTIMANMLGIFGGMLIGSVTLGLSNYDYFFKSFEIINLRDVCGGLFKATVFGFIIGSVGCFVGLRTSGGTQGVGNSTTRAVVISSVLVLAFDFILTKMLWIFENAFRAGDL
jgi:phospholipid/cholesterol/gamma-HCH transport system permease protein